MLQQTIKNTANAFASIGRSHVTHFCLMMAWLIAGAELAGILSAWFFLGLGWILAGVGLVLLLEMVET